MRDETTIAVLVPCRMHAGGRWEDACIHESARRLLVISSAASLKVGGYVDVRRGTMVITGRVIWIDGRRAGVRTQNPVDAAALVDEPRLAQRPIAGVVAERRGPARVPAARLERSRRHASTLQYVTFVAIAGGGAYLIASHLYTSLSLPFARISAALGN